MCGLAGAVSSYLTTNEVKAYLDLLRISAIRGEDSTGTLWAKRIYPKKNLETTIEKSLGDPYDFLVYTDLPNILAKENVRLLLGHCRSATQGKITEANAHPFQHGHIIGAHNGTIPFTFTNRKKFETDSETLIYNISKFDLHTALRDIDFSNTAYALTFLNTQDGTLNIIRNEERPLYIAVNKNKSSVFWASEKPMLEWILPRNEVEISDIYNLQPNVLVQFPLFHDTPIQEVNIIHKFLKPRPQKPIQKAPIIAHAPTNSLPTHSHNGVPWNHCPPVDDTVTSLIASNASTKGNIVPLIQEAAKTRRGKQKVYKGFRNEELNQEQLDKILSRGCAWCSNPQTTIKEIRWLSPKEFVCKDCKDNEYVKEYISAVSLH